MRLFVCEFITGGGLQDQALPDNLVGEGDMMLKAFLKDCLESGVADIITTRDTRLEPLLLPVEVVAVKEDVSPLWKSCMHDADAILIIAPESDNILYNLTLMAEQAGCHVLGSASEAVKSAGSKIKTANLLHKNKIPCIDTSLLNNNVSESQSGWVIKPDDGVGGDACYFCADKKELDKLKNAISTERFVIQEYIAGEPASISMLCYQGEMQLLACNKQLFSFNHDIPGKKAVLKGIVVNGLMEEWTLFNAIAHDIARADKGLSGYVGVDLIVTESAVVVVEINPRLTTSYAGLRESLSVNPAELILSIWQNKSVPEIHREQFLPVNMALEKTNVG